jgi:transmembrane sensor
MSKIEAQPGPEGESPRPIVLDQAAEWIVRLNDASVTERDFVAWQVWLSEHPAHARGFHEMQDTWQRSASVSQASFADVSALSAMRAEVEALVDAPRRRRRLAMRWAAMVAAVVIATIGVVVWHNDSNVVKTRTAELRSVRLPDGSRAALGPETRLEIDFSERTRSLRMADGEAYFEVVHSAKRPFSVSTPAGRFIAVGTAFSVHTTGNRVAVSVTEGTVRFEPLDGADAASPVIVSAGHRFIRDRARTDVEPLISVADAVAWQHGRLEYQGEPLRVVISDINRYLSVKLSIADPTLGELRYTGTVFPDALDAWVASIEGVFPVRIETTDGQRLIVHAQQPDR